MPPRQPASPRPSQPSAGARVTVVGVGADGWDGLAPAAREVLTSAGVLLGGHRQLDLIPEHSDGRPVGGRRVSWPSPLLPALPALLAEHGIRVETGADAAAGAGGTPDPGGDAQLAGAAGGVCVLASGDPMFYGIGATLVRLLGVDCVRVLPHPSSVSLACARLGWAVQDVEVVSVVGRPLDRVRLALAPRRRLLILSADRTTPAALAELLVACGYGTSPMTVLDRLGAPDESRRSADAADWASAGAPSDLNIVAVECRPAASAARRPRGPGLPDDAFEHDGQITKREIRAVTLARLGAEPGELLWDVGAGSGSVAVEWMRTHPACRAIAIEPRADRAERIGRNAATLGVPSLRVVVGSAPEALAGLPAPDAVFVGGGVSGVGVLEACWSALRGQGRLVVNAVTLESEAVLADWYARRGGDLVRLSVSRAAAVGRFTGWRPAMPVTQWTVWPAQAAAAG
ncbi:precorrin-6y C5,15-methyltransferase (decarboxylating) subunit CbiE [Frankia sp. AgB32]|uniref:precorrin-6y C5,15-methyltransferase (decarboxylating) subunit CbiE n=1 Tax=Frankia sp. AgB32 TaxID=631119 RepID=UPI00200E1029|nr:precorrin-6y C5,15-methyltransferase (decarboxylating) subunit CbiE [Frankia sp. AgB32]MCK9897620.1 precorrin-6y C5,15-methyltransferase (decarboxylating) subunit CbiE [Frankia sp. AgB32]